MAFGLETISTTISGMATSYSGLATKEFFGDFIEQYAKKNYPGKVDDIRTVKLANGDLAIDVRKNDKLAQTILSTKEMASTSQSHLMDVFKYKLDKLMNELNDDGLDKLRNMAKKSKMQRGRMSIK
jgi:hypothetical protein